MFIVAASHVMQKSGKWTSIGRSGNI